MKYLRPSITAIFLVVTSCTKPIDFDQANDFETTPVIESSFVFFNETARDFFDFGTFLSAEDFILIDFFGNDFIEENLLRADLDIEVTNSINRGFEIQVDFLDAADQLQHTFTIEIEPSVDNDNLITTHTEEFVDSQLDALKRTRRIVFSISILPGVPIDASTIGSLQLQSKVLFYFNTSF